MRKNWYKIALSKNLGFNIYPQWNNYPKYMIVDIVARTTIYYGKSRYKATKIIENFK